MTMINRCLTGKRRAGLCSWNCGSVRPILPPFSLPTLFYRNVYTLPKLSVTEEIGRSPERKNDDEVDSEGIDEKEVVPLARRKFTGDSIGKEAHQETGVVEEGPVKDHLGVNTAKFTDVQTFKSTNKGVGMSLEVLDEPSNESSSSSFDSELAIEDISSDDEVTEKVDEDVEKVDTVFDKSDGVKIADVEKDSDAQVAEDTTSCGKTD
ncbi:hypothetical protein Tco_0472752 [Tanacetum coccineum]